MKNHEDSYKYHLGFWTEKNHEHIFFNLTKLIYTHASGHVNFWDFKLVQKENGNTFTLLIIFIVKSLQKEQNSTPNLPE
jgi:hypothetical protein